MKRLYFTLIASLLFATGCSSSQERAEQSAATALALYEAGNFPAARRELLEALSERDDIATHWQLMGRIDLQMGRMSDALFAFSRVLELDATNAEALQLVAEISFQGGDTRAATSAADRMLALDPTSTRAMLVKGLIALDQRRLPEAIQYADSILRINEKDEFGIILKARAIAIGGDYEEAARVIEAGVPPAERSEPSLATLTEIYRATGDKERLVATVEASIARRPKDFNLKFNLAEILYKSGDTGRARSVLWNLLVENENNAKRIEEIVGAWADNDSDALSMPQLAKIARDGAYPARVGVARYLINVGKPSLAEPILRPIADEGFDIVKADAQALYGTVLFREGDIGAAKRLANKILEDDKDNTDALILRSRIALNQKDLRLALNDAQVVVSDFPQNEQGRILLADILLAKNDARRARQSYEEAISDRPQSLVLVRAYAKLLVRLGDQRRAIDVARTFTRNNPSSVKGFSLFSNICSSAGDSGCRAEAQGGLEKAAANYRIDVRPGRSGGRGLFGKL